MLVRKLADAERRPWTRAYAYGRCKVDSSAVGHARRVGERQDLGHGQPVGVRRAVAARSAAATAPTLTKRPCATPPGPLGHRSCWSTGSPRHGGPSAGSSPARRQPPGPRRGPGRLRRLRHRARATTTARPARPGRQPGRAAWLRSGEGASRPRARARATTSARVCVPSLAYRWEMWVLTVLCETYSSRAISRTDRLVGR